MKKHYFISARTQFDNLGDALINKVLFDKMRSKGNLHIDCKNVPDTYQEITKMLPNEIYKKSVLFYLKMIFYRFTGNDVFYILKPGHIFTISDTPKQMMRDIATIFIFLLFKII